LPEPRLPDKRLHETLGACFDTMVKEARIMLKAGGILLFALAVHSLSASDPAPLINAARTAKGNHDIPAAQAAYDSALELSLEEPGRRLTGTAVEVATFYLQQNDPEKAATALNRAIEKEDAAHVPAIDEISAFIRLSEVYSQQRRLADLASIQKRIVESWEASAGRDSLVVANVLHRLANTQRLTGDLNGGKESITRAIEILEANPGEAAATASALAALAQIEKGLGDTAAMKAALDREMAITRALNPMQAERVSRTVTAPRVITKKDPPYSEEARKGRIQGTIDLSLVVDENGAPQDITVVIPLDAALDEKAIETVRDWRFQPGEKNGMPVPVRATVQINLRLL
jgi:TonB family protein